MMYIFSSKIGMPQLGLTRLVKFTALLGSAWEISARTHHKTKSTFPALAQEIHKVLWVFYEKDLLKLVNMSAGKAN